MTPGETLVRLADRSTAHVAFMNGGATFARIFWRALQTAMSPSPLMPHLKEGGSITAARSLPMLGLVRALTMVATMAFALVSAQAADKAFKRDELNDSAIRLETQIKTEAGPVAKSATVLKSDADAAFK